MAGSAVEEIKARLELADLIGPHVNLKRSGRSLKGLCPFHGEKTPSFYVFPETGTWKCFGCGEGGDVFSFVQKRENLDFGEALRLLAGKAGVDLPSRQAPFHEAEAAEDRLRTVLAAAELYFKSALAGGAGTRAQAYLDGRGVKAESIERFRLGYAQAGGLLQHLQHNGFNVDEALEVGLLGRRDDGSVYEMFRDRIMFPIRDQDGRTIGFGGRTMGEGQPKYLNSPQTRFFDKSGCLFGLDLARAAIRRSSQAVIVEGYLDAIIAHQHGFENVVATLGTALTERHLDLLGRRASEIILALDADAAGQAATLRGLEVAKNAPADAVVPVPVPSARGWVRYQAIRRCQIKVLTMPTGLDPDEFIRRDHAEWNRLVGGATPVVDFLLSRLGERYELASARGKREAVEEAMGVIRDLADPVEREHYLQRLAAAVGLDEAGLRPLLNRLSRRIPGASLALSPAEADALPEAHALALYFLASSGPTPLAADDISSPEGRAVFELFTALGPRERSEAVLAALDDSVDPHLRPALSEVSARLPRLLALQPEQRARELEVSALKLRQRRLRVTHQEAMALASEPDSPGGLAASRLTTIASQLQEIEAALAARDRIGSLVWRSRQVGEVLGG